MTFGNTTELKRNKREDETDLGEPTEIILTPEVIIQRIINLTELKDF